MAACPTRAALSPSIGPSMPSMGEVRLGAKRPDMGPFISSEIICRERTIDKPWSSQSPNTIIPIRVPGSNVLFWYIVFIAYLEEKGDNRYVLSLSKVFVHHRYCYFFFNYEHSLAGIKYVSTQVMDLIKYISEHWGECCNDIMTMYLYVLIRIYSVEWGGVTLQATQGSATSSLTGG